MGTGIDDILRRQSGVIARRQALDAGMSASTIDRRVRETNWSRRRRAVYLSRSYPWNGRARVWSAVLSVPGSTLSGGAGSWWWDLQSDCPAQIELTVDRDRRVRRQPGIRILRRDLDPLDVTTHRGIPVTALPLSALHGAVELGRQGGQLLDRALQLGLFTFEELHAAYSRQLGSRRSAQAHVLMVAAGDGAAAVSERLLIALLRSAGVTGWQPNAPIALPDGSTAIGDLVFAAQRLVVELDSWAWHRTPDRQQRDAYRQNQLIMAGWTVLRFTWFDITQRPGYVLAQIGTALLRAAG